MITLHFTHTMKTHFRFCFVGLDNNNALTVTEELTLRVASPSVLQVDPVEHGELIIHYYFITSLRTARRVHSQPTVG